MMKHEQIVEELKPCPFCGGEAKRFTIGAEEPNNAGGDCIGCTRCGASSHVEFGRKENLVSRWNTRPTPSPDLVERLTRPIVGIQNRAAQEVFDIMCDRFRAVAMTGVSRVMR